MTLDVTLFCQYGSLSEDSTDLYNRSVRTSKCCVRSKVKATGQNYKDLWDEHVYHIQLFSLSTESQSSAPWLSSTWWLCLNKLTVQRRERLVWPRCCLALFLSTVRYTKRNQQTASSLCSVCSGFVCGVLSSMYRGNLVVFPNFLKSYLDPLLKLRVCNIYPI